MFGHICKNFFTKAYLQYHIHLAELTEGGCTSTSPRQERQHNALFCPWLSLITLYISIASLAYITRLAQLPPSIFVPCSERISFEAIRQNKWLVKAFTRGLSCCSRWCYSKTPIYRASQGKGLCPINRIMKYKNLLINHVFGGRGTALVNRGTWYTSPVNRGYTEHSELRTT